MNTVRHRRALRRWVGGWRRVEDFQTKEMRRMTPEQRYEGLEWLMQFAQTLDTRRQAIEREAERQLVQERWSQLKRQYHHEYTATHTATGANSRRR